MRNRGRLQIGRRRPQPPPLRGINKQSQQRRATIGNNNGDDVDGDASPPPPPSRQSPSPRPQQQATVLRMPFRNPFMMNDMDPIEVDDGPEIISINPDDLISGNQQQRHKQNNNTSDNEESNDESSSSSSSSSGQQQPPTKEIMGIDQGQLGCFACVHVGEFSPSIAQTKLQVLHHLMLDFDTTQIDQHAVNVCNFYEEVIRKPANEYLAKNPQIGQTPLPPWNPATIKSHIDYHQCDPAITVKRQMQKMQNLINYLYHNQILKQKGGKNGEICVDKIAVKAYSDALNIYLKLCRIDTRRLAPGAIKNNEFNAKHQALLTVNTTKKRIQLNNMSSSLDKHFHKTVLALKNGEHYAPATVGGYNSDPTNIDDERPEESRGVSETDGQQQQKRVHVY